MTDPEKRFLGRHFIAVATSDYNEESSFQALKGVHDEVKTVRAWLCDDVRRPDDAFRPALKGLAKNPTTAQIRTIAKACDSTWTPADAVAIYVTGHGFKDDAGRHYIAVKKTRRNQPHLTSIATDELIAWLIESSVDDLLLIVDLCYAGAALRGSIVVSAENRPGRLMLASTGRNSPADTGVLTSAIATFLDAARENKEKYRGQPYFSVPEFLTSVQEILKPSGQTLSPLQGEYPYKTNRCLFNPWYDPLPATESAIKPMDLVDHWGPRARGVVRDTDAGWFFTGRPDVMARLIEGAGGGPGTLLVTGRAGCGKSAVLARLVTLADKQYVTRHAEEVDAIPVELRPPLGIVDAAVNAAGKTPEAVLRQICELVQMPLGDGAGPADLTSLRTAWWAWLRDQSRPITIVVDSLDEADGATTLLQDVLAKINVPGVEPSVRLLVGVRSAAAGGEQAAATVPPTLVSDAHQELGGDRLRIDEPPLWKLADVSTYAREVLTAPELSPYRGAATEYLDDVTADIAGRANTSYRVALAAASSLAARPDVVDLDDERWQAALDDAVVGVFRDDLARFFPTAEREQAVHLMRAVAFAYGRGLPWARVWTRVATAVSAGSAEYGDSDLTHLLKSPLAGYLVTDQEDDEGVYRIADDSLRAALRENWHSLLPPSQVAATPEADVRTVEGLIAIALTPRRPHPSRIDDVPQPEYVRRHLVEHADAGGVLDDDVVPAWFLPYVDVVRLRQVRTGDSLPLLPVIRRAGYQWDWNRPTRNAAALRMWAALRGRPVAESTFIGDDWNVPWAIPSRDRSDILTRLTDEVSATATATVPDGPTVVIAGDADGIVRLWDLAGGSRSGVVIAEHAGRISAIVILPTPAGMVVVSAADDDERLLIVDVVTGAPDGSPLVVGPIRAMAGTTLPGGMAIVITGDGEGRTRLWDLAEREVIGPPLTGHAGPVTAVAAVASADGSSVWAVTGGDDRTVRVWNLVDEEPVGTRLGVHAGPVSAAACAIIGERVVATTGDVDGHIAVWDLLARRPLPETALGQEDPVSAMSVATLPDGETVLLSAGGTVLNVWRLTGPERHDRLVGHTRPIASVAAVTMPGGDVIAVTGGWDASLRSWNMAAELANVAEGTRENERLSTIASVVLPDHRVLVVTGDDANTMTIWDLTTDAPTSTRLAGHQLPIMSIATAVLPGERAVAVTACWDTRVRVWDLDDQSLVGAPMISAGNAVMAVATATLSGRVVAVTGQLDGSVRIWDVAEQTAIGAAIPGDGHGVGTVAIAALPDDRMAALIGSDDGMVRVWDLTGPELIGEFSNGPRGGCTAMVTTTLSTGRVVVIIGGVDGSIRTWDVERCTPVGHALSANEQQILALGRMTVTGPDGHALIVVASDDAMVRVWDVEDGVPAGEPLPTSTPVLGLTVLDDGSDRPRIVLVGNDFLALVEWRNSGVTPAPFGPNSLSAPRQSTGREVGIERYN